jgi:hypothetical protein
MSCKVDVDTAVKADILDCGRGVRRQIGEFLLQLQDDPLPEGRVNMDGAFFYLLPCGFFVSWEVLGDVMKFALSGDRNRISDRILGVGRESPH